MSRFETFFDSKFLFLKALKIVFLKSLGAKMLTSKIFKKNFLKFELKLVNNE